MNAEISIILKKHNIILKKHNKPCPSVRGPSVCPENAEISKTIRR